MLNDKIVVAAAYTNFSAQREIADEDLLRIYEKDLEYCISTAKKIYGVDYYVWVELSEGSWKRRVRVAVSITHFMGSVIGVSVGGPILWDKVKPAAQKMVEQATEFADNVIEHAEEEYSKLGGKLEWKQRRKGAGRVIIDISELMQTTSEMKERGEKIKKNRVESFEMNIQKNLQRLHYHGFGRSNLESVYQMIRKQNVTDLPDNFQQLRSARTFEYTNLGQNDVSLITSKKPPVKKRTIVARGDYTK